MDKSRMKALTKIIIDLIEDEEYPARKVIFDYMISLISEINWDVAKELEEYGEKCFKALKEKK